MCSCLCPTDGAARDKAAKAGNPPAGVSCSKSAPVLSRHQPALSLQGRPANNLLNVFSLFFSSSFVFVCEPWSTAVKDELGSFCTIVSLLL